jgi:hypothetical protein
LVPISALIREITNRLNNVGLKSFHLKPNEVESGFCKINDILGNWTSGDVLFILAAPEAMDSTKARTLLSQLMVINISVDEGHLSSTCKSHLLVTLKLLINYFFFIFRGKRL